MRTSGYEVHVWEEELLRFQRRRHLRLRPPRHHPKLGQALPAISMAESYSAAACSSYPPSTPPVFPQSRSTSHQPTCFGRWRPQPEIFLYSTFFGFLPPSPLSAPTSSVGPPPTPPTQMARAEYGSDALTL